MQPACKCKVLRLDGNALHAGSDKIVFKEGYEVGFCRAVPPQWMTGNASIGNFSGVSHRTRATLT